MTEMQVLGANIHLRYLKSPGTLIARLRPYQSSTHVVMVDDPDAPGKEDQTKYIIETARQLPETRIVARVKHRMDGGFHTKPQTSPVDWVASPDDFLNKWQHLGVDNMTLYALNEPDDGIDGQGVIDKDQVDRLNNWFVEVAEKAAERGVSITGPNFGKGIPALAADGAWHSAFDPILHVLSKHRGLHFMGLHEYGPEEDPFHLGRYKAMLRRCDQLGLAYPRIIFTEFGVDKADSGDQTINGYKSRGWSGTYYVNWKIDKLKRIYAPQIAAGIIVGVDVFSMGASSPEWNPFNVEEDGGYWAELTRAQQRGDLMRTKPITQFVPKPENARTPLQIKIVTETMRIIRSGPGTHFNDDGEVKPNQVVTLWDFPVVADGQKRNWKWVDLTPDRGGWMCVSDIEIKVIETFPPDPIPPIATPAPVPAPIPPKPAEPPTPVELPPPAEPTPERRAHTWKITLTATDEEAAQLATLAALALDALNKLAGAAIPAKDLIDRIVIEDLSP